MQPTYLPWLGYFHMIAKVDLFVFLDDVQFSKRSWQQRNKIAVNSSEKYLTIPVKNKGLREQNINEVRIDNDSKWQNQHIQLIKYSYSKYPFFNDIERILSHYNYRKEYLSDFTINLIVDIAEQFGLSTPIIKSSELPVCGKRSEYLYEICKYVNASEYLSAAGSREYIEQEGIFEDKEIMINYHQSEPYKYVQYGTNSFIPYLSVIDYIANQGFSSFSSQILDISSN
ncbi:WbqC family protein [Robertmurraya siralis]|nr:WbqC family protein [Robertmurraya siralis]